LNTTQDENKILMSKYAKNYLPIMFNVYTTELRSEKDPIRQSLIDTIKFFLYITDSELINAYLINAIKNYESNCKLHEEALKKISQTEKNETSKVKFDFDKMPSDIKKKNETSNNILDHYLFAKYSFLDLISILARYSNDKNINIVYDLAISGIENKELDKTIQKKSYKILDSILTSGKQQQDKTQYKQNLAINEFIKAKFEIISNKFVKSLSECNVAAKVPRLKCLLDLMDYINDQSQKVFLRHILPEVILCIREINHKSREASFSLLNSMLRCWQNLGLLSNVAENESLNEFMHLVMVGLAGSNNMVSCTCLALASLSYEFKENISGSLINDLIETACLLTRSDQKEIVISSLNLLKILITIFNQVMLAPYLEKVCESIHSLHEKRQSSNPNQIVNTEQSFNNLPPVSKSSQIRQLVKVILKKLIKKFSYEILFEKIFKYELINSHKTQTTDAMDSGLNVEENKKLLTGTLKHGLENLLLNIKKSIEKDRKRKEEQEKSEKNKSSNQQVDLISMYTSKTQQTVKTNYNE
jgi:ribosomal RNA-processing protein 12